MDEWVIVNGHVLGQCAYLNSDDLDEPCRALTPGPGCPRGIDWPCPRCKGSVTGKPVERRAVANV